MSAVDACRNALRLGYLIQSHDNGGHWLFKQRKFHPATVGALINNGEAVRVGECVVAWKAPA